MTGRVRHAAILLLVLALVAGQATALQLAAWVGMLATRLPDQGWRSALATTFDGEHPCHVCTLVERLRTDGDPRPEAPKPEPAPKAATAPEPTIPRIVAPTADDDGSARGDGAREPGGHERPTPEPPPPRGAIVG